MKVSMVRGVTEEDVLNKKCNIAVGISLGNKWFTLDNVISLVKFTLPLTREYLVVYVADTLHAINIKVRNKRTMESALNKARRLGNGFVSDIQKRLNEELSPNELKKIHYRTWDDLISKDYSEKLGYLYEKYKEDNVFYKKITGIVKAYTSEEEKRFTEDEIRELGTYILEELPEMLTKFPIGGLTYDVNAYPFDSEITQLAEEIQNKKIFPEICDAVVKLGNKGFVEIH